MDDYLDIIPVLKYYGAENIPEGGWRGMRCPFHEDGTASASVNTNVGAFKCFGCGISGDTIRLIMKAEKKEGRTLDYLGALSFYEGLSGASDGSVRKSIRKQPRSSRILDQQPRSFERGSGIISNWLRRDS